MGQDQSMADEKCPRCAGLLNDPLLEDDGQMTGTSYISEGPEILCFECRIDETHRHVRDGRYIPPSEWPMTAGAHDYLVTWEMDEQQK